MTFSAARRSQATGPSCHADSIQSGSPVGSTRPNPSPQVVAMAKTRPLREVSDRRTRISLPPGGGIRASWPRPASRIQDARTWQASPDRSPCARGFPVAWRGWETWAWVSFRQVVSLSASIQPQPSRRGRGIPPGLRRFIWKESERGAGAAASERRGREASEGWHACAEPTC